MIVVKRIFTWISVLALLPAFSQKTIVKNGSVYLSWGYNTEWYSGSDIHVVQPELNCDFTYNNIKAHDHIGWDAAFQHDITIPQYNYRLGYFFNQKQDLAFEINFDHTKYIVTYGQPVVVTGKINGKSVNESYRTYYNVLDYQLNNGANFLLFNLVKKLSIYTSAKGGINLVGLGKFGIGPLVPHVQNRIFGNDNVAHFQLGGWNTGLEAGFRLTALSHIYLEFSNKLDYARYSGLQVYKGTVNQSFFCYELILSLGYTFHTGKSEKL